MTPPDQTAPPAAAVGLRPLTARSVLLSVLLGTHPPELPVRVLVRAGGLFGIPDGTVRVALSRMAAEGEVVADAGRYRLAGRLLQRQRRQDEGVNAPLSEWDGSWDLVVADPDVRSAPARAALRDALTPLRMAEWRDGMWTRPANLDVEWPAALPVPARRSRTGRLDDPAGLARRLWDLDGWAAGALYLLGAVDAASSPADVFTVSAAAVSHLRRDPLLPAGLLPAGWPAGELRRRYSELQTVLGELLRSAGTG